jgi:hypothetical protein
MENNILSSFLLFPSFPHEVSSVDHSANCAISWVIAPLNPFATPSGTDLLKGLLVVENLLIMNVISLEYEESPADGFFARSRAPCSRNSYESIASYKF